MRAHRDDPSNGDPSGRSEGLGRLKRRAEFLRVGKGRRWHGVTMTIQTEARAAPAGVVDDETADLGAPRFGFTLTKKVGNAVMRNRARRRLREVVRVVPNLPAKAGHDYVIVGRVEALRLPFAALARELARGLALVHERSKRRDGGPSHAASGTPTARGARSRIAKSPGRAAPERIKPAP